MSALGDFLRPRDPNSGWFWAGSAADWAAMGDTQRAHTEELAIANGGQPPLSWGRVMLLVGAAGGALWAVSKVVTVRPNPRRNPRRRRRNPYPDHSRRKWASYANTVSRRERARTGYAFPRVEPNSHVGDLVEWLNFASIARPSLRGVGSRLLRQLKSKGESVIRDRAWRLIGNLSERDEF